MQVLIDEFAIPPLKYCLTLSFAISVSKVAMRGLVIREILSWCGGLEEALYVV